MRSLTRFALGSLLVLALSSGCQRLNDERTVTLDGSEAYKLVEYDAPRSEQKVTVTVSSPGTPISAYLVTEGDKAGAMDALLQDRAPASALDRKEKSEAIPLQGTVPAKTAFALLLKGTPGKKAEVKVKTVGR